jgi:predicted amidohydrolase YtcJ
MDARGGALIPGLADHHAHPLAMTAARESIDLRGEGLPARHERAGTGWLRVIGLGALALRTDLDQVWPRRPVRAQHRSGALWTLNSAAVELLGSGLSRQERETGQLWRADDRLRTLLVGHGDLRSDLAETGRLMAAYGLTHLTDASASIAPETAELMRRALPQHLMFMAEHSIGSPRKIVPDDRSREAFADLTRVVQAAHDAGRAVAIHAVSGVHMAMVIAALAAVGVNDGDRIEHAAICDDEAAERLAALGVVVVTQPTILVRHGERFCREVEPYERPLLWRYGGLRRRGVKIVASSDAPYGDANPWRTIRDAATRRLGSGRVLGDDEVVRPGAVLRSFLTEAHDPAGPRRRVEVGSAADLCLLAGTVEHGLRLALSQATSPVAATFVAGKLVYRATSRVPSETASLSEITAAPANRSPGKTHARSRSRGHPSENQVLLST